MGNLNVVIPTMNRNEYLREILSTIPKEIKVVISDNGSFLSTEFIDFYENIIVYQTKNILEMYENWNQSISFSESEYIMLPSDDDLYLDDTFNTILKVLLENPNADILIFGHYYINDKGEVIGEWKPDKLEKLNAPEGFEKFKYGVDARWPSIVIKKSLFDKVGYFDTNIPFAGDSALLQKMLLYGNAVFIPEIISCYRVWKGNGTSLNQATYQWRESVGKWTSEVAPLVIEEYKKINKNFNDKVYKDEILAQNIIGGGYLLYNNHKYDELDRYLNENVCPQFATNKTKEAYFKLCLRANEKFEMK